MATKKNKIEIDVKDKIMIKGCILSFSHLAEKNTTGQFPSNAYSIDVYVPKTEAKEKLTELLTEVQKAGEQIHGKKLKWDQCTDAVKDMDVNLEEEDEYKQYKEGMLRIRAKSKKVKPVVMNGKKEIMSADDIKGMRLGSIVNIIVNIFPWEAKKEVIKIDNGVKSIENIIVKKVSFGLIGVQYVKEGSGGEGNVSAANDMFDAETEAELVTSAESSEDLDVGF